MKKLIISLVVSIVMLFPLYTSAAAGVPEADIPEEHVSNFHADIAIQSDGVVLVTEEISYEFGSLQKHGIFRTIPIKYTDTSHGLNTDYNLRVKVLSITDEQGTPYSYKTSYSGDSLELKIGDSDKLVSGSKIYRIKYQVERTVSYFSDHDELYWDIIGPAWKVPIEEVSAHITVPGTGVVPRFESVCYTGESGSTHQDCVVKESEVSGMRTVDMVSNKEFFPGEALTAVVGFPKGIVAGPSTNQTVWWFVTDNWPLATPVISFVIMFSLWYRKGREPKGKGVIIAQYEPPRGLSPIEVGTLMDQKADKRDVASLIIDLAVRGFIKIRYISKTFSTDYEFVKLKDAKELSRPFEQVFFKELFGDTQTKKLSSLKNKFYETTKKVTSQVYQKLTSEKYFIKNPQTIRLVYAGIGFMVGVAGIPLSGTNQNSSFLYLVAFCLAGAIIALFGLIMPQYTKLGIEAKEEIQGFKLFLSVTEQERLKFHNAPAKKPQLFEKYLPYAMALKVEKEWANQFKDIFTEPPSWYEGNWSTFNMIAFTSSLNSFSSSASSAFMSSPGGSSGFGGGSSGGGFGGGGGGSW